MTSARPSSWSVIGPPRSPSGWPAGIPGYAMELWFGAVAPAGTPKPVVDRLSREIAEVVKQPAFKKRFVESGVEPLANTPEAFAELIGREIRKWIAVVKDAGVLPQ